MSQIEALKLALEALKANDLLINGTEKAGGLAWCIDGYYSDCFDIDPINEQTERAITAIREALAQSEQEPVVWMYQDKTSHAVKFQRHMSNFVDHSKTSEIPLYSEPLANHELQCVCGAVWCGDEMVHLPNKIPPQRKPLTDEEIDRICGDVGYGYISVARAIEAAHGIKE